MSCANSATRRCLAASTDRLLCAAQLSAGESLDADIDPHSSVGDSAYPRFRSRFDRFASGDARAARDHVGVAAGDDVARVDERDDNSAHTSESAHGDDARAGDQRGDRAAPLEAAEWLERARSLTRAVVYGDSREITCDHVDEIEYVSPRPFTHVSCNVLHDARCTRHTVPMRLFILRAAAPTARQDGFVACQLSQIQLGRQEASCRSGESCV